MKLSEETKKKISNTLKGRTGELSGMFGKHHSAETREKISKNRIYKTGENHPAYKGVNGSYGTQHRWIRKKFEEMGIRNCQECGTDKAKRFDCANLSGKYLPDISDWKYLCRTCHHKLDDIYKNIVRNKKGRFTKRGEV